MAKERARMKETQTTPATPEEIERFKQEHGITDLEKDPPGTETRTIGQYMDEVLERRRAARSKR
jgi:hypothetical protein